MSPLLKTSLEPYRPSLELASRPLLFVAVPHCLDRVLLLDAIFFKRLDEIETGKIRSPRSFVLPEIFDMLVNLLHSLRIHPSEVRRVVVLFRIYFTHVLGVLVAFAGAIGATFSSGMRGVASVVASSENIARAISAVS